VAQGGVEWAQIRRYTTGKQSQEEEEVDAKEEVEKKMGPTARAARSGRVRRSFCSHFLLIFGRPRFVMRHTLSNLAEET
jgi:hypothetical protein